MQPNQTHQTPDSLMWGRQCCVVVFVVVVDDIFVSESGKGFRYFDATHYQVSGFLNYEYGYKMHCRPFAVGYPHDKITNVLRSLSSRTKQ